MAAKSASGLIAALALSLAAAPAWAASVKVPIALATAKGAGETVGSVTLKDGKAGVSIALNLKGLPPGKHGFHVHANPSCDPAANPAGAMTAAQGAGAHLDPGKTNSHLGPDGMGHMGDLPLIEVAANGSAHQTLTTTRFKSVAQMKGHALMIHAGGDSYSDTPPLGGGGGRMACGVVK